MWSQVSHQPPMSANIGLRGFGQWRSSKTQKSCFSTWESHETGNWSSPRNCPRTSSVAFAIPPSNCAATRFKSAAFASLLQNRLSAIWGVIIGGRPGRKIEGHDCIRPRRHVQEPPAPDDPDDADGSVERLGGDRRADGIDRGWGG